MVIEVDDSGWGDLLGGVVIVLRRVETDEEHADLIPINYFREPDFKYQEYLRVATQIILDGLDALEASRTEEIRVCTGFILSSARESLKELGYKVQEAKIKGATQELAESEFIKSLVRMGVGEAEKIVSIRSFRGFLDWVKEDLESRERYVKTGWSSWRKYREEM
jgi:hypothetical protein